MHHKVYQGYVWLVLKARLLFFQQVSIGARINVLNIHSNSILYLLLFFSPIIWTANEIDRRLSSHFTSRIYIQIKTLLLINLFV